MLQACSALDAALRPLGHTLCIEQGDPGSVFSHKLREIHSQGLQEVRSAGLFHMQEPLTHAVEADAAKTFCEAARELGEALLLYFPPLLFTWMRTA
jgi:hypothetical protein